MTKSNTHLKKISDYKQEQLPLPFRDLLFENSTQKNESRTIELYDSIPKYDRGKERSSEPVKRRVFECRGKYYQVDIFPARLIDESSNIKTIYPGIKEELVEDALRKMACDKNNGVLFDGEAGVVFTLYSLQKELKEFGHTYSIDQLKEALFILQGTTINLKTNDGSAVIQAQLFEAIGLKTFDEWKERQKGTDCYVKFNPLVTKSIKNMTYRPLNLKKCMEYKFSLARWLHKRISHNFIQASSINSYSINLTTIVRDSGMKVERLSSALQRIIEAIEEMVKKDVLSSYEITEKIFEKRKLVEAKFKLNPSLSFIHEMKIFNAEMKKYKQETIMDLRKPI